MTNPITTDLDLCDHIGTERHVRTAHGFLNDAPAGTKQNLCADCGEWLVPDPMGEEARVVRTVAKNASFQMGWSGFNFFLTAAGEYVAVAR